MTVPILFSPSSERRLSRTLLACLLAASLANPVTAQAPSPEKDRVWTVADQSGGKNELRVGSGFVGLMGLQIPTANLTSVMYDQQARSKGAEFAEAVSPILWTGYPIGVALILAPFKTRMHYITLGWKDGSEPRGLTFRAEKGDYQAILQELARVTGKPWRDIPAELKKERDNAPEVSIDRLAEVGAVTLKPGTYRVAIRELPDNSAEAVFYRKGPRPVAQASVKLFATSGQVKAPQPVYKKIEGSRHEALVEILMPDRTIRFAPQPPAAEAAVPPHQPSLF